MDFNKAFGAYDDLEGANCLTTGGNQTQKEAAIEAVEKIGLNRIREVNLQWFADDEKRAMFEKRLALLKEYEKDE